MLGGRAYARAGNVRDTIIEKMNTIHLRIQKGHRCKYLVSSQVDEQVLSLDCIYPAQERR